MAVCTVLLIYSAKAYGEKVVKPTRRRLLRQINFLYSFSGYKYLHDDDDDGGGKYTFFSIYTKHM